MKTLTIKSTCGRLAALTLAASAAIPKDLFTTKDPSGDYFNRTDTTCGNLRKSVTTR